MLASVRTLVAAQPEAVLVAAAVAAKALPAPVPTLAEAAAARRTKPKTAGVPPVATKRGEHSVKKPDVHEHAETIAELQQFFDVPTLPAVLPLCRRYVKCVGHSVWFSVFNMF